MFPHKFNQSSIPTAYLTKTIPKVIFSTLWLDAFVQICQGIPVFTVVTFQFKDVITESKCVTGQYRS